MKGPKFILASGSKARTEMLKNAGFEFDVHPADLDEENIQKNMEGRPPLHIAQELARQKAVFISQKYPDQLVIGSDQVLVFENKIFSKSNSPEEAKNKLLSFKGKTHHLISAISVCKNAKEIWNYSDEAFLFVKDFSDNFLNEYIEAAGDSLTSCVGGYALEGVGIQLFEKIEGNYFTILGMPLLPLLNFLSQQEESL